MKNIPIILVVLLLNFNIYGASTIWKLDSIEKEFYLAGSVHVLRKTDYPLPVEFEKAYQNVDRLIFETVMDEFFQPELQLQLMTKGIYQNGETLKENLTEVSYKKLKGYCAQRNLPIETLQQFKPWMLILTMTVIELQKNGINPADGMDLYFNQKAKKDSKETGGLVSVKEHLEAISSFGEELNDILIENYIEEMKSLVEVVDDLIKAWRIGHEEKIDHYVTGQLRTEYPQIYQIVFADRNRRWLEVIETLIHSGEKVMIIVGCGHIVGQDGLLQLLNEKGYKFQKYTIQE